MIRNALVAGLLAYGGILGTNAAWDHNARAKPLDLVSIVQYASVNLNGNCSGVVIDAEHVLTAAHCVRNFSKTDHIKITVDDRSFLARWTRKDFKIDLALLNVPRANFTNAIALAPISPSIGSDVYCIGNPFGRFENSITKGILGNKLRISDLTGGDRWQFDCTGAGGISGGMIINEAGDLVSIFTEGFTGPTQAGSNYSFGTPLDEIKDFLDPNWQPPTHQERVGA